MSELGSEGQRGWVEGGERNNLSQREHVSRYTEMKGQGVFGGPHEV